MLDGVLLSQNASFLDTLGSRVGIPFLTLKHMNKEEWELLPTLLYSFLKRM